MPLWSSTLGERGALGRWGAWCLALVLVAAASPADGKKSPPKAKETATLHTEVPPDRVQPRPPETEAKTGGKEPESPPPKAELAATPTTTPPAEPPAPTPKPPVNVRQVDQTEDCDKYQREHPEWHLVIFDAQTGGVSERGPRAFKGETVRVCLTNLDFRQRYQVTQAFEDLAPPDRGLLDDVNKIVEKGHTANKSARGLEAATLASTADKDDQKLLEASASAVGEASSVIEDHLERVLDTTPTATLGRIEGRAMQSSLGSQVKALDIQLAALRTLINRLTTSPPANKEEASRELAKEAAKVRDGAAAARGLAEALLAHLGATERNVFSVQGELGKFGSKVEVVLRRAPLVKSADGDKLTYGESVEVGHANFEIRVPSYVRYALGLVYTNLRDVNTPTVGRNDLGAPVLSISQEPGVVPLFLVTHYWCGADEREVQPWDEGRGSTCKWVNTLLPTFTIGLPLSKSPLEHLFVGLTFQPVPLGAFTFGMHLGQVKELRPGFAPGAALPADSTGFRADTDPLVTSTRIGWYAGVMFTDAELTRLLRLVMKP